jgi:uncharacterized protein
MLYDNAQLARVYLHAWRVTDNPIYRTIAERTLDYVARESADPQGGFYSSQDADSEGVEGKFFVWRPEEIRQGLGGSASGLLIVSKTPSTANDAPLFMDAYGVSKRGNFEGKNILLCSVLLRLVLRSGSARSKSHWESRRRLPSSATAERTNYWMSCLGIITRIK